MKFEGIYTAIITPFRETGSGIDEGLFRKLIDRQIEAGIQGIIVAGSTGEGATLEQSELADLLKIAVAYKGKIQVIGACGSSGTQQTLEKFKYLAESGVEAALISTPAYNKPPQRGIIAHYQKIAETAPLPIMVYNIPGRTAVNILPATMQELWKIPNVYGLKESSGNWDQVSQFRIELPKGKSLLSGEDAMNLAFLSIGAQGAVSVLSNVVPKASAQLWNAWKKGDAKKAEEIHNQTLPFIQSLFMESNPIPAKWCLSQILGKDMDPRLPLVKLDAAHYSKLKAGLDQMRNLGFL